ncbi:prepilin-type N-terminal cleavage/methylation domain-containing protein [bacterium]|nr:prepilin-type N-terminal cleavage/methylation domain-containing protein [bacterium]
MRKGFTIIELMVSIFVGMTVFAGIFTTFRQQNVIYLRQETKITLNQDVRIALDIMQRYIRRSGISRASCLGSQCTGVSSSSDGSKIILTSDLNLNGTIETNTLGDSEQYAFIVNNNTLYFCFNTTSYNADRCEFLLTNLVSFTMKYYLGSTELTSNRDTADKIRVTLQTQSQKTDTLEGTTIKSDVITTDIFLINKTFRTN